MKPSIRHLLSPQQDFLLSMLTKRRSGWLRRGIATNDAETVEQHVEKVIYATQLFATLRNGFDPYKAIQYSIVHDFPEIIAPDYTPHDKITPQQKHRIELDALVRLTKQYGVIGEEIVNTWLEYEAQATPTSRIVFQLDKVDAAIQSLEYAKQGYNVEDFIPYARKKITDVRLAKIYEEVVLRAKEQNAYKTYFTLLKNI